MNEMADLAQSGFTRTGAMCASLLFVCLFVCALLWIAALAFPAAAYAAPHEPHARAVALEPQESSVDFYAVLSPEGELVFQKAAPEANEGTNVFAGSLAGYPTATSIPWHEAAQHITSVRFARDFADLQPLSLAFWFQDCAQMTCIDLANLDASHSTSMRKMFEGCSSLAEIRNLGGFKTSSSTYFGSMFSGCSSLESLDVSHFDATHVEVLCFMFNGCAKLKELNMSGNGWKTSSLRLMVHVWEGCSSLAQLDLSKLDTSGVGSMTYDFNGCTSLERLDLSGADTTKVGNLTHMFDNCPNLASVTLGGSFSFNGSKDERQCALPDGNWKSSATGLVYAADRVPNCAAATYTLTDEEPSVIPEEPSPGAEDAPAQVASGLAVGKTGKAGGCTYRVTSNAKSAVTLQKAARGKAKLTVPAKVKLKGKVYAVTGIAKGAFKGAQVKTLTIKTKSLAKKRVKGCFKGARKLSLVKVPKSKRAAYRTLFKRAISGKAVKVK